MDLSTIYIKFSSGDYPYPSSLREDLSLMFQNCFTYNTSPKSLAHIAGKSLQAYSDSQWAQLNLDFYEPEKTEFFLYADTAVKEANDHHQERMEEVHGISEQIYISDC